MEFSFPESYIVQVHLCDPEDSARVTRRADRHLLIFKSKAMVSKQNSASLMGSLKPQWRRR